MAEQDSQLPASWQITMDPEDFERVRADSRLHAALDLGRAANALRFSHRAYLDTEGDDTPAGVRQRVQAFFLSCATMYEALKALDRLGRDLSHLEAWQEFITPIQRSGRFRKFRDQVLPRLRNKFVFHFDADVAPEALRLLDLRSYVFATATGQAKGDVYFELADTVAVNFLLDGLPHYGEIEAERRDAVIRDGVELTVALVDAIEVVLSKAVVEMGWVFERRSDGA